MWRTIWVARGDRPAVQARANPKRYVSMPGLGMGGFDQGTAGSADAPARMHVSKRTCWMAGFGHFVIPIRARQGYDDVVTVEAIRVFYLRLQAWAHGKNRM